MLDHDQLTPEEIWEQNQPLIEDLRRYYNTRAEDNASLARIQARLLERQLHLCLSPKPRDGSSSSAIADATRQEYREEVRASIY